MRKFQFITVMIVLLFMNPMCWASGAFVTDSFRISLRRGPSIENKILKFLPSGQPVKILNTENGWSHVSVQENNKASIKGWVLNRYLVKRLPWERQTMELKQKNNLITEELMNLESKYEEALALEKATAQKLKEKKAAFKQLKKDYSTLKAESAEYLKLKKIHEENIKILHTMNIENESLKASSRSYLVALGALILLSGLIIGVVIGRQNKRHQSPYL